MDHKRRQLIVDPDLQKRVMRDVGALPFVSLAVGVLLMGFFTRRILVEADASGAELPSILPFMAAVLAFIVVTSFALLTQGMRISNRIAGPQVRFKRFTEQVLRGESGVTLRLRDQDYAHATADEFNRLIRTIDELRQQVAALEGGAGQPEAAAATDEGAVLASRSDAGSD